MFQQCIDVGHAFCRHLQAQNVVNDGKKPKSWEAQPPLKQSGGARGACWLPRWQRQWSRHMHPRDSGLPFIPICRSQQRLLVHFSCTRCTRQLSSSKSPLSAGTHELFQHDARPHAPRIIATRLLLNYMFATLMELA